MNEILKGIDEGDIQGKDYELISAEEARDRRTYTVFSREWISIRVMMHCLKGSAIYSKLRVLI